MKEILPDFVGRALDAAFYSQEGVSYKIAKSRGASETDKDNILYDSIIPVDTDATGMLQMNMHYSNGFHQFLELKHQLSMSDVSLMTNYQSYYALFTRFQELYGVSGTLGTEADTTFLEEKLGLNCIQIPCHMVSRTRRCPDQVCGDDEWLETVVENIHYVTEAGQAVLVICKDMNSAENLFKELSVNKKGISKIQSYWRDDNQKLGKDPLQPGEVVISTALSSRGVDIPVSEKVVNIKDGGGGLHVLLTYLPSNARVERQIIGRTGRQGLPGSTRCILNKDILEDQIGEVTEDEIKKRRDDIELYRVERLKVYLDRIVFEDDLFSIFCSKLAKLKHKMDPSLSEEDMMSPDSIGDFDKKLLLEKLKRENRKLDFLTCKDALKQEWAMWLMKNTKRVSTNRESERSMIKESLGLFLDDIINNLMRGECTNFYQKISNAVRRSILFDELDPVFIRRTWETVENEMNENDRRLFGSSVYYNRYYDIYFL